jgi:hypothetical protein
VKPAAMGISILTIELLVGAVASGFDLTVDTPETWNVAVQIV